MARVTTISIVRNSISASKTRRSLASVMDVSLRPGEKLAPFPGRAVRIRA
jgi:hypothetical protein